MLFPCVRSVRQHRKSDTLIQKKENHESRYNLFHVDVAWHNNRYYSTFNIQHNSQLNGIRFPVASVFFFSSVYFSFFCVFHRVLVCIYEQLFPFVRYIRLLFHRLSNTITNPEIQFGLPLIYNNIIENIITSSVFLFPFFMCFHVMKA